MPSKITEFRVEEPRESSGPRIEDAIAAMTPADESASGVRLAESLSDVTDPEPEVTEDLSEEVAEEVAEEEEEAELEGEEPGDDDAEDETPESEPFKLTLSTAEGADLEVELDGLDDDARAAVELLSEKATVADEMAASYTQVREQAQKNAADKMELQLIEDELRSDPVTYIEEHINEKLASDVVVSMLHNDDVLRAVEDKLEEWMADPSRREVDAANLKVTRIERKNAVAAERAAARTSHEESVAVYAVIEEMIDPTWDRETKKLWVQDAIQDVSNHVSHNKIDRLSPDDVPNVLKARMKQYGATAPDTTKRSRVSAAKQAGEADAKLAEAKKTAKRIKTSVKRRRQAAGTPTGVSASPGSVQLKKGANLDDALAELKKRTRQ